MSRALIIVLAIVVAVACERPSERAARERQFAGRMLQGTLAHPQSVVVGIATGTDAAEVSFSTPAPVGAVIVWYREALRINGWEIKNEAREADGTTVLYAQNGNRPLWIRLRETVGAPGTTYSLIGAQVEGDTIR